MTLIIPPGFGNAAFIFTSSEGTPPFVTTLGFDISAWGGDFVAGANFLMEEWTLALGGAIDSALTLERVSIAVGQDGPSGSVDSDLPPAAMTRTSTGTAFACSALVRKVTNEIGRRGRGRMFVPGTLSQSELAEDGSIATARITDLTSRFIDFDEAVRAGGSGLLESLPVLFHSQAPADPSPITGFAVADLVGIQRGRIR